MSTDQTPALARATEALNYVFDEEPRTALADLDEPTRLLLAEGARAAVSAALHDPDDPDWLARALYEQDEREEVAIGAIKADESNPWSALPDSERYFYRSLINAVRAAILGADQ